MNTPIETANRSTARLGGWPVMVAYALVCAATQVLWLTYAAVTTETARRYGVSVGAVGLLAEIFPLLYVVLAIPAGALLDRWFRPALVAGGLFVGAGGLIRVAGETFAWAMAGQIVVAIAQPVVLSAVSKLAGEYLPRSQRAAGISLGSAGSFVGMLLALILGPTVGGHGQLERLLDIEAVLALVAAFALAGALRRPGGSGLEHAAIAKNVARILWAQPRMRALCGIVFIGFGVFVALATWLQTLLHPSGVSEATAGALLVGMVLAGVFGCAALPQLIARRGWERAFMLCAVLASCVGCVALGVVPVLGIRVVAVAVMGLFLLSALPVVLTATERFAGPVAGTAGAIVWMAGNLGGLIVAFVVQILVHEPPVAFLVLAGVSLLGLPLVTHLRTPASASEPRATPQADGVLLHADRPRW